MLDVDYIVSNGEEIIFCFREGGTGYTSEKRIDGSILYGDLIC